MVRASPSSRPRRYATALSIPATCMASYLCFGTPLGAANVLGTGVMLVSLTYFYVGAALFDEPGDQKS